MASKYASREFWIDAFDRATASAAQGFVAAAALDNFGLLEVDWQMSLSAAGSMGLLSLLTSVIFRGNGGVSEPERKPYHESSVTGTSENA